MKVYYKSFNDFLADASILYEKLKKKSTEHQRYGQVYFNLLDSHRPDIAEKIRSTKLDPFFHDEVKKEIHEFVESQW